MSNPANYYASSVHIPAYFEASVVNLNNMGRLKLASDLIRAMKGGFKFNAGTNAGTQEADWLNSQSYDSLLSVLKWVTSELL
jgi:hypothetical protein